VMSTGSSVGSVVWPILLANLPDRVGFGWTCRIMALLCGICGVISYLLLATRLPRKPRGPIFYKPAWRNPQYVLAVLNFWVSTSRPCASFGCIADALRPHPSVSLVSRRTCKRVSRVKLVKEREETDRTEEHMVNWPA
jgi:MFS family permease